MTTGCRVESCSRPAELKAAQLCRAHYRRQRAGQPLDPPLRDRSRECCLDGCSTRVTTAQEPPLCGNHKYRRRTGDYSPVRPAPGRSCAFEGCVKPSRTKDLCAGHYAQQRRRETLRPLGRNKRHKNAGGYITIYVKAASGRGGRVMEHRLVMEGVLGRPLRADENVHHRNGVRDDNRPENLELWVRSQPAGQRVTDVLAWAREIVERYGQG